MTSFFTCMDDLYEILSGFSFAVVITTILAYNNTCSQIEKGDTLDPFFCLSFSYNCFFIFFNEFVLPSCFFFFFLYILESLVTPELYCIAIRIIPFPRLRQLSASLQMVLKILGSVSTNSLSVLDFLMKGIPS